MHHTTIHCEHCGEQLYLEGRNGRDFWVDRHRDASCNGRPTAPFARHYPVITTTA